MSKETIGNMNSQETTENKRKTTGYDEIQRVTIQYKFVKHL